MGRGLPTLSRDKWAEHENFPAHVLLVGSHRNFRAINRQLIAESEAGDDLWTVGLRFSYWIAAMRSHERYEEQKLYPYLARRYGVPLDEGAFAEAKRGHEELHAAHDRVMKAVEADDRAATGSALRRHARVLGAHLDQEEEIVIPALLELSRSEFREYYEGSVPELMRKLAARGL